MAVGMGSLFEVNLYDPFPYDASALVLSCLAWPGAREQAARDNAYLSLCAFLIRDRAARDEAWGSTPQAIVPNLACRAEDIIHRDLRTIDRRMRDRVIAGHIGAGFLMEVESGTRPALPEGARRLSVNEMSATMADQLGLSEGYNVSTRAWRPSLPVIHLCVAWATIAQEYHREHGVELGWIDVARRRELLTLLLYRAEKNEPLLERSRLKIRANSLTRFRLVKPSSK